MKFLTDVDEEMILQAGLLADYGAESLSLIRFFDPDELDNALIASKVKEFISSMSILYNEGRVWACGGYAQISKAFLERRTHFMIGSKLGAVGGPRAASNAIMNRCLKRMQAILLVSKAVIEAEHPSYELVSCFRCFNLADFPEQSTVSLLREGRSDVFDAPLKALASYCDVRPTPRSWKWD